MIPHSAAFDDAVVAGPTVTQRLTVYRGGEPILDEGLFGVGLSIMIDETAASVRQLTGAVADPDGLLYPHLATDPLAPYGAELFVEIGVEVAGGDVEYVPAGMFRLWASGSGDPHKPIAIKGLDRAAVIARAGDEVPWSIDPSTPLASAVTAYAQAKYPGLIVLCDPDSAGILLPSTPTVWLPGAQASGNPWANMAALAASYGRQIEMDAVGRMILRPVPDLTTAVQCWEYAPGARNLAAPAAPIQDTTGVVNVAVIRWEGSGVVDPQTVIVEVTDPTSPIYPALFGRSPGYLTSQLFTDTDQMVAAGAALLVRRQGASTSVPFTAGAHPAHEPGDVVRYASTDGGFDGFVALSKWTLDATLRTPATYTTRIL